MARLRGRLASVRVRTTVAAVLVVGSALLVGGFALASLLRTSMIDTVTTAAKTRADEIANQLRAGQLPRRLATPNEDAASVQVVDRRGVVVASSSNVVGERPIARFQPHGRTATVRTIKSPIDEQERFRVVARVAGDRANPLTVYVASSLATVDRSVATVVRLVAVGGPLLLVLVGLTAWRLAGRALMPVEAIRAQVDAISPSDLDRRVPQPSTNDEIERLAVTMNRMLDRLQASIERQRQFVADASHELRSPLTNATAELEVALDGSDLRDWPATGHQVLREQRRMQRLVDHLLVLARSDERRTAVRAGSVDLSALVRAELTRVKREDLEIDGSGIAPAHVEGDADQLRHLVANLLDNARRYARSRVTVEVTADTDAVELVIADDGPGIPPAERSRVFERFARVDQARSRRDGGFGLGLAIARQIADTHDGRIYVADSSTGARLVVRLPLAATSGEVLGEARQRHTL